jgi:hypothetical protein
MSSKSLKFERVLSDAELEPALQALLALLAAPGPAAARRPPPAGPLPPRPCPPLRTCARSNSSSNANSANCRPK